MRLQAQFQLVKPKTQISQHNLQIRHRQFELGKYFERALSLVQELPQRGLQSVQI